MDIIKKILIFIFCAGFVLGGFFYGSTPTISDKAKVDSLRKLDSLTKVDTLARKDTVTRKDTAKKAD